MNTIIKILIVVSLLSIIFLSAKTNAKSPTINIPIDEIVLQPNIIQQQILTLSEQQAKMFIYMAESGNNLTAVNASSGACGIGQRLPCSILIADCPNWETDYVCQDKHFSIYAMERYGSWSKSVVWWKNHLWW